MEVGRVARACVVLAQSNRSEVGEDVKKIFNVIESF